MMLWPRMAISPTSSVPSIVFHSGSTSFTSTPQIGTPIEPGRGSRSGSLKVATGEVSDSPYPSRIWTPNALLEPLDDLHRQRRAAGDGHPQVAGDLRHVDALGQRAEQAPVHRRHAGEEGDLLAAAAARPPAAASNRGSSTRVEPTAKPAFICTVDPKEWNSGSVIRCRSCWVGSDAEQPVAGQRVEHQVGVRQLGALGLAGRAARVEDDRGVGLAGERGVERRAAGRPAPGRASARRRSATPRPDRR